MATLVIMLATGWMALTGSSFTDPQPVPINAVGGMVKIPVAELSKEKLAKYVYRSSVTDVRFLLVRYADGSISTALDACQICGPKGYGQEGETAICKNCNAPIAMDTIGQGGGCNPLPLAASLGTDSVVIAVEELARAGASFR